MQPESQGAPSSLAGTAGSLPQSWESGAGWAGTAARQRQVPEITSSHANSTALTDLVRTGFSIGHFSRLSSAAAGSDGETDRFRSFLGFGKSAVNRASIWRNCWVDHTCKQPLGGPRRAGVPARAGEPAGKATGGSGGESLRCSTNSKAAGKIVIQCAAWALFLGTFKLLTEKMLQEIHSHCHRIWRDMLASIGLSDESSTRFAIDTGRYGTEDVTDVDALPAVGSSGIGGVSEFDAGTGGPMRVRALFRAGRSRGPR